MRTTRHTIIQFMLFFAAVPAIYFYSYILISYHTGGDQQFYRNFYDALAGASISDIPFLQSAFTGSSEPLYGILMWIGSNSGIEKDVFISIFNSIFLFLILKLLIKNNANPIFIILLFVNFYVIVLITSAERLKFAYLCLAFSAVSSRRMMGLAWAATSPFMHFQSLIFLGSMASGLLARIGIRRSEKYINPVLFLIILIVIISIIYFILVRYSVQISDKLGYYIVSDVSGIYNIIILTAVAMISLPRRVEVLLILSSCAVAAFILSGDRVNIVAVTVFIYFCIIEKRTYHPAVLLLMAYFGFKSIEYVENIFLYGSGFIR